MKRTKTSDFDGKRKPIQTRYLFYRMTRTARGLLERGGETKMYESIILAIACLSAPLFAKYAGYEIHKKPFDMVGVAGLFFLLGAAFSLGPSKVEFMQKVAVTGSIVSHVLGWMLVIVGAFRSTLDVLMEKEEEGPVKRQADLL